MDQSCLRSDVLATDVPPQVASPGGSEALRALVAHAEARRAGALARPLAERALAVTRGADPEVTLDALDALLRRLASSRDDELRVVPERGGLRVRHSGRSYHVWLGARGEASCSCPDFAKAALGACKHTLAAGARGPHAPRALRWDPVRPLTGAGDWMARLWHDPRARLPRALAALFSAGAARRRIDPSALRDPQRATAVGRLLEACRRDPWLAEPAVLPQLERAHAALARRWSVGGRELDQLLAGMKQPLFPYQREGVLRFLRAGRLLLADDMGLGKTAQAIAACHALFAAGQATRAIIVAPAALKPQWAREWRAFTDLALVPVEGSPDDRAAVYRRRDRGVLLVNYEQLLRDLPLARAYEADLVVLDEAQRIKNWETRTAAVVKQLAPAWRLVLTGTPMENRLDELASIMEWVDEHALEPRWRLASWHAVRADDSHEIVGARDLETLRQRLAPHMVRRVRRDVLAQLPARRDHQVAVEMCRGQRAAHHELERPIAALLQKTQQRPLTRGEFLRLMQLFTQQRLICNGMALARFERVWPALQATARASDRRLAQLESPKLAELRDRLIDLAITQRRKVVVFSQWRRMLQLAAWAAGDALTGAGVRVTFFTGAESQRRRTENLVAFHEDPDTRVLFATDAGGVGLNLQRAASCCINLDLPWNPAVLEQRIGRIFRLGQQVPVDVYNLVATGGIEERIAGLVGDKRALFVGLFDGNSNDIAFDAAGSFMDRLARVAAPEPAAQAAEPAPSVPALAAASDPAAQVAMPSPAGPPTPSPAGPRAPSPPGPPTPSPAGDLVALAPPVRTVPQVPPGLCDVGAWLAGVEVRALDNGHIALNLPRAAAAALGGLLRALASAVEAAPAA